MGITAPSPQIFKSRRSITLLLSKRMEFSVDLCATILKGGNKKRLVGILEGTLFPIIMEVENHPKRKEANILLEGPILH